MVGGVADVMTVSLKLVVIPCGRRLDDVREFPYQLLWRLCLVSVLGGAVLYITAAGVQKRRMRLGDAHDIGAHIMRHRLDVTGHRCRVIHSDLFWVDLAFVIPVDHRGEELPAIGEMIRRRHAG